MDNSKYQVEFIALNLTDEQFKGYCLGMSLVYMRRAMKRNDNRHASKSMIWWDGAYDKYKHNCKG